MSTDYPHALGLQAILVPSRDVEVVRRFAKAIGQRAEVRISDRLWVGFADQNQQGDIDRDRIEQRLRNRLGDQCAGAGLHPIAVRDVAWRVEGDHAVAELTALVVPADVFDAIGWDPS